MHRVILEYHNETWIHQKWGAEGKPGSGHTGAMEQQREVAIGPTPKRWYNVSFIRPSSCMSMPHGRLTRTVTGKQAPCDLQGGDS